MSDRDQIVNHLKSLHMPTMRRSYEETADQVFELAEAGDHDAA